MWLEQILKHRDQFIPLLKRLRDKTFSKRGFSWSGKLLSSTLLTLTHTYPLENKFVNPEQWDSDGTIGSLESVLPSIKPLLRTELHTNHHQYWGKLYSPDEVRVCAY